MAKKTAALLPSTNELLHRLGERLRFARLRRRLSAKQLSERAGMSPMTLRSLERGGSGVTIGAYLAVMQVLGIERDLDLLGKADPVGRELQDARLPARPGADGAVLARPTRPRNARVATGPVQPSETAGRPQRASKGIKEVKKTREPLAPARGQAKPGGFASAEVLAGMIDRGVSAARPRRR